MLVIEGKEEKSIKGLHNSYGRECSFPGYDAFFKLPVRKNVMGIPHQNYSGISPALHQKMNPPLIFGLTIDLPSHLPCIGENHKRPGCKIPELFFPV